MNDIHEASEKFHAVLYADDTSLIEPLCTFDISSQIRNFDKNIISQNINKELQSIYNWLCVNKLSLNIPKTKFMIFHHKQRRIDHLVPDLEINGNHIEFVETFNFLGITIDENLSFSPHIEKVSNKISRAAGILNKLKRILPRHILRMLYNTLVLPHLQYGILCWGRYKTDRLFKLQKRAVRNIKCSKYNAHTNPIFKDLKLLKVSDLYNLSLLKFFYKLKNGQLPYYFRDFLIYTSLDHSYNTRGRNEPQVPLTRTTHAMNSARMYLPIFLESTPALISDKVNTHSKDGFSLYCKNYYISQYDTICNIPGCYVCSQ